MIRKLTPQDIPAILELVQANPDTLLPRTEADYLELLNTTWVAEQDGIIVGSCVLELYSPKIAEIRTCVVDSNYRGQGIGEELVKVAIQEGQQRNIREILVVTSKPEYFKKLGFGDCLHEKYALFWTGSKNNA
ncbi:MAG: GNAT family N-acetyltransferase [bacterium]